MPLTITTITRCNHIFTSDFAEMIIKALIYTQNRSCQKIITTTSTIQLYNWHYINLFSEADTKTSSKLWHRPVQSRTTKTKNGVIDRHSVQLHECCGHAFCWQYDECLDVRRTANTCCLGRGGPKLGHDICAVEENDGQWTPCWLTLYRPMQDFRQCLCSAWTPDTMSWHILHCSYNSPQTFFLLEL